MNWEKENIPDFLSKGNPSLLYYRIHTTYKSLRRSISYISPSAFKYADLDGKMSTNWSKYSNAQKTREDAAHPLETYGVVSLVVPQIRNNKDLDKLKIEHDPIPSNRAHTNIDGLQQYEELSQEDYRQVQVLLARIAKWEIHFP